MKFEALVAFSLSYCLMKLGLKHSKEILLLHSRQVVIPLLEVLCKHDDYNT